MKFIINQGGRFEDPEQSSTVWVQNSFAIASTVFAVPFEIYFALNNRWEIVSIFFITQLILMASILLNSKGQVKTSKVVIISIFAAALPVYSSVIGYNSGFYIYYTLGPALIGALFDYSQKRFFYFSVFLTLISIAACFYLGRLFPTSIANIDQSITLFIFKVNLVVCFLILSFVTFHMVKHHYQTNGRLKDSNNELQKLIQEKEVLLAEVHHRVKNNMAVMTGLIKLQMHQTSNQEAKDLLYRNAERLQSMSMIHNYLYVQKNLDQINFKEYLTDLTQDLITSYGNDQLEITAKLDIDKINIPLNKAIPLGLITNEIIVNSFKHGFLRKNNGQLFIALKKQNNEISLIVADDGIGFDVNEKSETLGTTLIRDLVEQLDGKLLLNSCTETGTEYEIRLSHE